jgi:hypothetical protein
MAVTEIGWEVMGWVNLAEDRNKWQAVVYFRIPLVWGIFGLAEGLLASPEGLSIMRSV